MFIDHIDITYPHILYDKKYDVKYLLVVDCIIKL
jgi:hypothetical protein